MNWTLFLQCFKETHFLISRCTWNYHQIIAHIIDFHCDWNEMLLLFKRCEKSIEHQTKINKNFWTNLCSPFHSYDEIRVPTKPNRKFIQCIVSHILRAKLFRICFHCSFAELIKFLKSHQFDHNSITLRTTAGSSSDKPQPRRTC